MNIDMFSGMGDQEERRVRRYPITPVAKPRMTQRDKWKDRACVNRYRAFKDEVRTAGIETLPTGDRVFFILPIPKSWPKKKQAAMLGQPHQGKPDADNLLKALWDAVNNEDQYIFHTEPLKFWGAAGEIIIQPIPRAVAFDGENVIWAV